MKSTGRAMIAVLALALGACASGPDGGVSALHGIVFDGEGAALAGVVVRVHAAEASGDRAFVTSDVRGRFVAPAVKHGRVVITAEKEGYEPARTEAAFLDATQIVYLRLRSTHELVAEAERLLAADRPATALATARRTLEMEPNDPVVRYGCAALAARAGAYEEARAWLAWFPEDEPPKAVVLLRDRITREAHK
ncbi:MAG: carboxypeptidase-like regulatory domain-containing protein [Spirochaetota bacterium]